MMDSASTDGRTGGGDDLPESTPSMVREITLLRLLICMIMCVCVCV